jgi:hypothetical protein
MSFEGPGGLGDWGARFDSHGECGYCKVAFPIVDDDWRHAVVIIWCQLHSLAGRQECQVGKLGVGHTQGLNGGAKLQEGERATVRV